MTVRTRFAPSPTGWPHLGFIRTFLYDYAIARKNSGQVVIRLEDTDRARLVKGSEEKIYEMIKAYGMDWDEGPDKGGPYEPYRQSERLNRYKEAAEFLIEKGFAYYAFDSKERLEKLRAEQEDKGVVTHYDKRDRGLDPIEARSRVEKGELFVVRLKLPNSKTISYKDFVLNKEISWQTKDLDDIILLKSDGYPTYHLGVVVDDVDMKITHVLRGQEWIASTPYHVFLYGCFNYPQPEIGHLTVIFDPRTGKKFSKRDLTGKFLAEEFLVQGYLPEAVLNCVMLLGWAPKDNREVFSLPEFVEAFDPQGLQKANPVFDESKLKWFAGYYIRSLPLGGLVHRLKEWVSKYRREDYDFILEKSDEELGQCVALLQERSTTLDDIARMLRPFFYEPVDYAVKEAKGVKDKDRSNLKEVVGELEELVMGLGDSPSHDSWEGGIRKIASKHGWKDADAFMLLRVGIFGGPISPPLYEFQRIIGSKSCRQRLSKLSRAL